MPDQDSDTFRDARLPTNIYLARHGRTSFNATGVLRGHLDPPLDEVGILEVRALAGAIRQFRPKLVVSSPLLRARETARRIADECGANVEIDARLIDRDYGQWAGHSAERIRGEWGSIDAAPGVEPSSAVLARALAALDAIADCVDGGAAVVAHDVVNRLLISSTDPEGFDDVDAISQRTGCFNLLQRSYGHWRVVWTDVCPPSELHNDAVAQ